MNENDAYFTLHDTYTHTHIDLGERIEGNYE